MQSFEDMLLPWRQQLHSEAGKPALIVPCVGYCSSQGMQQQQECGDLSPRRVWDQSAQSGTHFKSILWRVPYLLDLPPVKGAPSASARSALLRGMAIAASGTARTLRGSAPVRPGGPGWAHTVAKLTLLGSERFMTATMASAPLISRLSSGLMPVACTATSGSESHPCMLEDLLTGFRSRNIPCFAGPGMKLTLG